jgi:hypothetical protein
VATSVTATTTVEHGACRRGGRRSRPSAALLLRVTDLAAAFLGVRVLLGEARMRTGVELLVLRDAYEPRASCSRSLADSEAQTSSSCAHATRPCFNPAWLPRLSTQPGRDLSCHQGAVRSMLERRRPTIVTMASSARPPSGPGEGAQRNLAA